MVCIILLLYSYKIQLTFLYLAGRLGLSATATQIDQVLQRSHTRTQVLLYSQLHLSAAVTHSSTQSTASLLEE